MRSTHAPHKITPVANPTHLDHVTHQVDCYDAIRAPHAGCACVWCVCVGGGGSRESRSVDVQPVLATKLQAAHRMNAAHSPSAGGPTQLRHTQVIGLDALWKLELVDQQAGHAGCGAVDGAHSDEDINL